MKTEKDFPSIVEAVAYINQIEPALEKEIAEHNVTKAALADAESVASDAIAKAEEVMKDAPKSFTSVIAGIGKIRVNFGVDGLSKEALLNDVDKIAALVKKGSHAITVLAKEA